MKKTFRSYLVVWAVVVLIFSLFSFVPAWASGGELNGYFYFAYILILISFLGQLLCARKVFYSSTPKKLFLNLPLINVSYGFLTAMLVVGGIFMLLQGMPEWNSVLTYLLKQNVIGSIVVALRMAPEWLGALLCFCLLLVNFAAVTVTKAAVEAVGGLDDKIAADTLRIKSMQARAEGILSLAESATAKKAVKEAVEALKYSDPVSKPELAEVESRLQSCLEVLEEAAKKNIPEQVEAAAKDVLRVVKERSTLCKQMK